MIKGIIQDAVRKGKDISVITLEAEVLKIGPFGDSIYRLLLFSGYLYDRAQQKFSKQKI